MAIGGEHCNTNARARLRTLLERGVRVYHMYGLTEMSVWQTMTRITSEKMIFEMPILIKYKNMLTGKYQFYLQSRSEDQIIICGLLK